MGVLIFFEMMGVLEPPLLPLPLIMLPGVVGALPGVVGFIMSGLVTAGLERPETEVALAGGGV